MLEQLEKVLKEATADLEDLRGGAVVHANLAKALTSAADVVEKTVNALREVRDGLRKDSTAPWRKSTCPDLPKVPYPEQPPPRDPLLPPWLGNANTPFTAHPDPTNL